MNPTRSVPGNFAGDRSTGELLPALLEAGLLTAAELADARRVAEARGQTPLTVLLESQVVSQADLLRTAATVTGLDFVDVAEYPVDASAVARLPAEFARRRSVLPLCWRDGELLVAVGIRQAGNIELKDDLARLARSTVRFAVAPRGDIAARIEQVYRAEGELDTLTSDLSAGLADAEDLSAVTEIADEAPIVRFVNLLVSQAIADRASDIHLEPGEGELRVRYRIDGVLHEAHRSPRNIQNGVISRLKIMSDINIAERRIPQDGRLSVTHNGRKIDLRVATLPTVWGEKVVARILDNSSTRLGLDDLGFSESNRRRFAEAYTKPYGMILVTGPTGSGKSTTLYATLNILNRAETNIITVEDPVEYRLPGINQVQTNPKAGLTFASALRAILRADPDIVLIGEIRDHETAHIAVEAALTGHLVLSTLHTNDAPSAVTRLIDMGIEPFLVGSALDAVLAQRLCRLLCEKCREPYEPKPTELMEVGYPWTPDQPLPTLYRATGCAACATTGYHGRIALHEVMTVTENIQRLVVRRAPADEMARLTRTQGMATLREDGWLKVARGLTSIEEILRVVA
jgi:type IV pilus assembly protein PilB